MSFDLQTLSLIAGIAGGLLTALGVIGTFYWRVRDQWNSRFDQQDADIERIERENRIAVEAANERAKLAEEDLRRALDAHRLYAAEHFATEDGVEKALEPVLRAIERLGDRLDQLLAGGTPRATRQRSS